MRFAAVCFTFILVSAHALTLGKSGSFGQSWLRQSSSWPYVGLPPGPMPLALINTEVAKYRDLTWGDHCCDVCAPSCTPTKRLMTRLMNFTDLDKEKERQSWVPFLMAAQKKYDSVADMYLDAQASGGASRSWIESQDIAFGGQTSFDLADSDKSGFLSYSELQDYTNMGLNLVMLLSMTLGTNVAWDPFALSDWNCDTEMVGRTRPHACTQVTRDLDPTRLAETHHIMDHKRLLCLEGLPESLAEMRAKMMPDTCIMRARWEESLVTPGSCASRGFYFGSAPPKEVGRIGLFFNNEIQKSENWHDLAFRALPDMVECYMGRYISY